MYGDVCVCVCAVVYCCCWKSVDVTDDILEILQRCLFVEVLLYGSRAVGGVLG